MRLFPHGVASGDPTSSAVTLWTRTTAPTVLWWEVADDAEFSHIVSRGSATHEPHDPERLPSHRDADNIVRVRVQGLGPGRRYWYRFRAGDAVSPGGLTSTLPAVSQDLLSFRLGVASCARWTEGPFTPYRQLAHTQPDLVLHLGDYIYETAGEGPRGAHEPAWVCQTADDYSQRYRQYRSDDDLQALHAAAPWVSVWDDHEFSDDAWRWGSADRPAAARPWHDKRDAAARAYRSWMPQQRSGNGPTPLDRHVELGSLADLVVVDVRMAGRERPVDGSDGPTTVSQEASDSRRLLTDAQWEWLEQVVAASTAPWLLLATSVQLSPLTLARTPARGWPPRTEPLVNPDQWDGYPHERRKLLHLLARHRTSGVLALSGDLHGRFITSTSLGPDDDAADGASLVVPEVTTPAVSSPSFVELVRRALPVPVPERLLTRWLQRLNPHVTDADLSRHGATTLDITAGEIVVRSVPDVEGEPGAWRLRHDGGTLQRI